VGGWPKLEKQIGDGLKKVAYYKNKIKSSFGMQYN
jgi:hypothetical protein